MNITRTSNGSPSARTVTDPPPSQGRPVPAPEGLLPEPPAGDLERVAPDPAAQNAARMRASADAQAQRMRSSLEGGLDATAAAHNASGDFANDPRVMAMVLELLQQLGFDISSLTDPAARQAMQGVQRAAGLPSTGDLDLDTLLALLAAAAQRDRDGDAAPSGGGAAGGTGGAASGARQAGPAGSAGGGATSPAASGTRQTRPVDVSNWKPGSGDVTAQQLNQIVPTMNARKAAEVAPHLNRAMAEANINTPQRKAAFIAQVAHESGGFKYNEEIASGRAYEGRADLGNTQPGDGVRFKGRGYIQLTGRANYTAAGKALGLDLVNQPELAAKPENAARVAAWYWNSRGLNKFVDQGNFDEVTRRINGGYNGKVDRDQYFDRGLTVLKDNQGLPSTGQFVDKPVDATTSNTPAGQAQVDSNNPTLRKLATGNLQGAGTGLCVTATLDNMQRFGIPQPAATGNDVGNNPRGGMVQMMKDFGWKSVPLPGATQQTIKSPYGTVNANVIPAAEYQRLAEQGKIPSGAIVFQTRHASWNSTSAGSRGFDMGIARDGGRTLFNYADMGGPMVYGASTRSVVVLVPGNALR